MGRAGPLKAAYLICTTPRSGSWLLADALDQTGLAGHPQEYFMDHVAFDEAWGVPTRDSIVEYLDHVRDVGTSANGVCGIKLHWSQLCHLADVVGSSRDDTSTAFAWLAQELAPLQVVRLDRTDKIRQALSYHRAETDHEWWRLAGDSSASSFAGPDLAETDRLLCILNDQTAEWDRVLAGADVPVRAWHYEQLCTDLSGCVLDCLLAFGVAFDPALAAARAVRPRLVKQSDHRTDQWVHEFITWRRSDGRPVPMFAGEGQCADHW